MTPASVKSIPSTPRRVVLARHGATAWSKNGRHTGTTDLPLLTEGETEARSLHRKLSGILGRPGPRLVLTSPLARARDTCRLTGYGDQAVTEDDLAEWDYGRYEGLTTAEIRAERPGWDLFSDGCPGGEGVREVARRVERVIWRLKVDPSLRERDALLFAHGHLLRVLAGQWCGFGIEAGRSLRLETGAVSVLGWSHDNPVLQHWNL
ncbi:MAG: histidine phosphatase family protein [Acidimicrobiales bacterium]